MHLSRSKASDKMNLLKATYKQAKAKGKKKMKPEARKLHNAVNNNNVFEAVWFTCATALEKRVLKKICLLSFPYTSTTHRIVKRSHIPACGVQACGRARNYPSYAVQTFARSLTHKYDRQKATVFTTQLVQKVTCTPIPLPN